MKRLSFHHENLNLFWLKYKLKALHCLLYLNFQMLEKLCSFMHLYVQSCYTNLSLVKSFLNPHNGSGGCAYIIYPQTDGLDYYSNPLEFVCEVKNMVISICGGCCLIWSHTKFLRLLFLKFHKQKF